MIIKRKLFAIIPPSQYDNENTGTSPLGNQAPVTSKDLQIEQMKLQRQLIQTQNMRQKMQAEERMSNLRQSNQLQKMEQKRDKDEKDNQVKLKKSEDTTKRAEANNTPLYKVKSKPVQPVPMKS